MNRDLFQRLVKKPGIPMMGWLLGVGLAAAMGGLIWLRGRSAPSPAPTAAVAAPTATQRADVPLPSAKDSDAQLRAQLAGLTPLSRFHDWLSAGDLLSRWVSTTDKIAFDVSPRADLPFLSPDRPFKAVHEGGGLRISSLGYARYDAVGTVAGSIDAHKFAEVYRALHPLLESAYHQLGYPDRSIDGATAQALQRLCDAPVRDKAPKLERSGSLYIFADSSLESLGPVEKALLRMGPHNTRLVQQAAREMAAALNLPLRNPPQAAH